MSHRSKIHLCITKWLHVTVKRTDNTCIPSIKRKWYDILARVACAGGDIDQLYKQSVTLGQLPGKHGTFSMITEIVNYYLYHHIDGQLAIFQDCMSGNLQYVVKLVTIENECDSILFPHHRIETWSWSDLDPYSLVRMSVIFIEWWSEPTLATWSGGLAKGPYLESNPWIANSVFCTNCVSYPGLILLWFVV